MDNNENFYKAEYESLRNKNQLLRDAISKTEKIIAKQTKLLEECWERIYYKKAWLTLSDGNIKGMQKHIEEIKQTGKYNKLMLEE